MKKIQIAIDGPASSGKSTVAKIIARNLDLIYLDTGAMYRVATFVALQKETDDAKEIIEFIEKNPISFRKIFKSAFGKTTVPISRPSMIIPPFLAILCCSATMNSRISVIAEI